MSRGRARFGWYAGVAFMVSLFLAAPLGRARVEHTTLDAQDVPSKSASTKPSARLQPSDDALRRFDRIVFEPALPLTVDLFHAIPDRTPAEPLLALTGAAFKLPRARAPPASA